MNPSSPWARHAVSCLVDLGVDVHVYTFARGRDGENYINTDDEFNKSICDKFLDSVESYDVLSSKATGGWRYFAFAPKLRRELERRRVELLLTLYGGGYAALAYFSGFRPYVVYAVGSDILSAKGFKCLVAKPALRTAKIIFSNGDFLASRVRTLAPKSKVIPLLLGVDSNLYSPVLSSESPVQIVCSRGFLPVYNNEYLIQGLALLPEDIPEFEVKFMAGGPLLEQVKKLADRILPSKLKEKIRFLGGAQQDQWVERIQKSHIYVTLSRSDGTSSSLLEALSCGLFPVASDIPQNREWISPDKRNGLLVPLDQPEKLAGGLANVIRDGALRRRARDFNRLQVIERAHSMDKMQILKDYLESIIQNRI